VREDKYGALLQHVYEFSGVAEGSAESADSILHHKSSPFKTS
jgi:hypothetical protein